MVPLDISGGPAARPDFAEQRASLLIRESHKATVLVKSDRDYRLSRARKRSLHSSLLQVPDLNALVVSSRGEQSSVMTEGKSTEGVHMTPKREKRSTPGSQIRTHYSTRTTSSENGAVGAERSGTHLSGVISQPEHFRSRINIPDSHRAVRPPPWQSVCHRDQKPPPARRACVRCMFPPLSQFQHSRQRHFPSQRLRPDENRLG